MNEKRKDHNVGSFVKNNQKCEQQQQRMNKNSKEHLYLELYQLPREKESDYYEQI